MTGFGFGGPSMQQFEALVQRVEGQRHRANAIAEQLIEMTARVCELEAREKLREQGRQARRRVEFRSQFGEDAWIWKVLDRQTSGFFIEVGAFDGYHYSVSYGLEAMGWSGLLIEALPGPFEKCRARRTDSRVVHAALSRPGAPVTMEFTAVSDQYGGMLSYLDASGSSPLAAEHARMIEQSKVATEKVRVPVTTMDALLEAHKGPIDAAAIDVEGGELDLLAGFDLKKWKPRVLVLEDNSGNPDSPLGKYMSTQPYLFAGWVGVNRTYVHESEARLLENLRRF